MKIVAVIFLSTLAMAACNKAENKAEKNAAEASNKEEAAVPTPAPAEASAEDADLVARGEYLAGLMGCEHCHTPFKGSAPDQDKRFAGGLEIPEAFGTWRSLNITQDKETGIGSWTDEEIINAIRVGKRPDGEQLFLIMPYLFYNVLSDGDAKAIVAYLRTVPAVSNPVERKMDLQLPQIPAPPASGAEPDNSDPVARGAYLTSIMHCAACHTPETEKGPDMSRMFGGGMAFEIAMMGEGKLYSSNLSSHETGLANWSDEQIVAAITQMRKRGGGLIAGPMAMYQRGWFGLSDEDSAGIVAFLRSLPAIDNVVPESTFKPHAAPPGAP